MSTRGAIGIRINGQDKLSYNHSDSYPEGLGVDFVKQVRKLVKLKSLVKLATDLRMVKNGETEPTKEEIKKLSKYSDTNVSDGTLSDWYCLLRNLQGDLAKALKVGYAIDSNSFIVDSLFCEYAYILNLDDNTVEFYEGFQHKEHDLGRYGHLKSDTKSNEYWGCALVGKFPMNDIPRDWAQVFTGNEAI